MKTYKVETRTVDIVTVNAKNEEHAKELIIGNYYNTLRSSEFFIRKETMTKKKKDNKQQLYVGGYDKVTHFKTLSLKVSEFEKINDISNEDFRGVLSHAQTIYFLIDFYNQKKIKKVMKQNKIESVLPYDNKLITS
jgi:hypothetical protein